MGESLVTLGQLLETLHMGRSSFYEKEAAMKAKGLQEVRNGRRRLFRAASIDRLIVRAAERGESLC